MKTLAKSFLDFAQSEGENTRVRASGEVELASRNGFSNPDFRDIDANGKIEGVELLAGPVPTGSHQYVRYLRNATGAPQRDTKLTRQNSQVVDLDATYPVNEPIVEGTEPPDPSRRSALPAPPAPGVEVVTTAKKGFAAPFSPTYYGIAVCGVVGNPRRAGQMSFTTPGPISTVIVGQGNYIRVFLQQLTEGYSGLAILATEPKASVNEALNGTLYFQRILDGRRRIRNPYPLVGPLKTRTPARTVNETFIAGFGEHPGPRLRYGPGGPFTLATFSTRITYQVETDAGWSADQQYTNINTTGHGEATASGTFGASEKLVVYTAASSGARANRIRIIHGVAPQDEKPLAVFVNGLDINVQLGKSGGAVTSTAADVAKAVNASREARALVSAEALFGGTGIAVGGSKNLSGGISGSGKALYVRLPRNARQRFPGAKRWLFKMEGPDGLFYAEAPLPLGNRGRLQTNDPNGYHPSNKPEQSERVTEDATGVPAPDAELDDPEAFGPTLPLPGTYAVRQSLEADGKDSKESPPSKATLVTIAQGQYFKILPADVGNRLPNADFADTDPETGDPEGWNISRRSGVVLTTNGGVLSINDITNGADDYTPSASPMVYVGAAGSRETLRLKVDMFRYVSGRVALIVRYFDAAKTQLGSYNVVLLSSVTTAEYEVSFGPSGSPANVAWPVGTAYLQYAVLSQGSVAVGAGSRDFGVNVWDIGSFRGLAASRKHPDAVGDLVPDTELATDSYHPGPYTVALDNPASRHADLASPGITLNAVESYAPYGTKAQDESLLVGYRTPVTGGLTYEPSVYAGWWGVSVATGLLEAVLKDAKGNTVQQLGPLVSGVSGTSDHARRIAPAFTAHEDAVYFEIVSGGASDGRVVVMAFQLDEGAVTAYTNQNALSGTRTVLLDTKLPLADIEPRLEWLSFIRSGDWVNASAIFTNDTATDVTYRFRTTDDDPRVVQAPEWSAWTTDFALVPKRRFWQLPVTLTTTDPTQSPLLAEVSVEAIRMRPMLLRPDGSEYPGGIQAIDVTAPYPVKISESVTSDSNVNTTRYRGQSKDMRSMDLQLYSDDAAEMLIEDIQTGEPNVIDEPRMGKRLGARLQLPDRLKVDREAHFPTTEAVKSWILDGSTEFEVVSEEKLN